MQVILEYKSFKSLVPSRQVLERQYSNILNGRSRYLGEMRIRLECMSFRSLGVSRQGLEH